MYHYFFFIVKYLFSFEINQFKPIFNLHLKDGKVLFQELESMSLKERIVRLEVDKSFSIELLVQGNEIILKGLQFYSVALKRFITFEIYPLHASLHLMKTSLCYISS